MVSKLLLDTKPLTINQAIHEIQKVLKTCNQLNIAELVDKRVLKTCFICNAYIGLVEDNKLTELYHTEECEPIDDKIGSLISGEIRELFISNIKYNGRDGKILKKNKYSDWSLEKVQEQLQSKSLNFKSMGFEPSYTTINTDTLMIDSKSLYEYLDIRPEKLLNTIDDLTKKLDFSEKEILLLKSKGTSTYSTPALDVVKAVIKEFWEDWTPESDKNIKQVTIKKWIGDNFPNFQSNASQLVIDQVCRNPKAKEGGKNRKSNLKD